MKHYQFPVLGRREFKRVLGPHESPFWCTFVSGVEPSELAFWMKPYVVIERERMAWMDEQGFTFSAHAEIEDRRDPAFPDRPFHMMGMCAYKTPPFEPDWAIHYRLTFNNEAAPMAYAMRWRGVS